LPLDAERRALLQRLTEGLDPATRWWVSGYLAGLATPQTRAADGVLAGATALPGLPAALASATTEVDTLTIVYGSQTGNAKRAAESLLSEAGAQGLKARLLRADAYPLAEFKRETQLIVVISTQGDGDPPDDARGNVRRRRQDAPMGIADPPRKNQQPAIPNAESHPRISRGALVR
jgi:sulfite reductase (NADPH) flavoprotein alpha-component